MKRLDKPSSKKAIETVEQNGLVAATGGRAKRAKKVSIADEKKQEEQLVWEKFIRLLVEKVGPDTASYWHREAKRKQVPFDVILGVGVIGFFEIKDPAIRNRYAEYKGKVLV